VRAGLREERRPGAVPSKRSRLQVDIGGGTGDTVWKFPQPLRWLGAGPASAGPCVLSYQFDGLRIVP